MLHRSEKGNVERNTRSIVQVLDIHVIVPLSEVQVTTCPLHFATLEVHRLAPRIFLFGHERHAIVLVHHHAPRVDATQIEIGLPSLLRIGSQAERLIDRHPTDTLEVDFCPVVQVPCAGLHHEAALEVGRDARNATQSNEEQRHLAAIAMTVVEHIFRDCLLYTSPSPRDA